MNPIVNRVIHRQLFNLTPSLPLPNVVHILIVYADFSDCKGYLMNRRNRNQIIDTGSQRVFHKRVGTKPHPKICSLAEIMPFRRRRFKI